MKLGWFITSVIHGTALGAVVFSFANVKPLEFDDVKPVEVEIVSVAPTEQVGTKKEKDLTVKKAIKPPTQKIVVKEAPKPVAKPKPAEKPKPKPKPKPVVKPAPKPVVKPKPVPKPAPKVEPIVEPAPSIEKLIEQAVEPVVAPEKQIKIAAAPKPVKRPPLPKKKPKPKPKPKKKPKALPEPLDDGKISALLDKLNTDSPDDFDLDFGDTESGGLEGVFDDNLEVASLSQFEFNAVKNRMASCWSIPAGAQDAGSVVVKVGFNLNRFAEVVGRPRVLNSSSHPSFNVMADSAVRAILECGPYDMLPPEKFDVWSEFSMEFDPRSMFSG